MHESPSNLACDLLRLDDLDGANRIAEDQIERAGDQGNGTAMWRLRFVRAEVTRLRGSPEKALRYLESQHSFNAPDERDLESRSRLSMHLGYHLGLMARFGPAHRLLSDAESMSSQSGLIEVQAEVWLRQAMLSFLQKDYVASEHNYRLVLGRSGELGGWYFRAMALWGIGKNLMIQRQYKEATPWLEESLEIFGDVGARLSLATVWGELAVCHLGLGDDTKALELFESAVEVEWESGAIHNYQVGLANIGNVYLHRRDYLTALSYYQKALALAREIKDPVSVKKWTYNIRLAYARIRSAVDEQYPRTA